MKLKERTLAFHRPLTQLHISKKYQTIKRRRWAHLPAHRTDACFSRMRRGFGSRYDCGGGESQSPVTQMSFAARRDLIPAAAPQTNLMPLQLLGLAGAFQVWLLLDSRQFLFSLGCSGGF